MTLRAQIIEIASYWIDNQEVLNQLADEILALLQREGWVKIRSADESCEHTTWYGKGSISVCADCHKTYEEVSPCYCEKCVGDNDMSFEEEVGKLEVFHSGAHGETHVERLASEPTNKTMKAYGCECRYCEPELWDKDERGVWYCRR